MVMATPLARFGVQGEKRPIFFIFFAKIENYVTQQWSQPLPSLECELMFYQPLYGL